MQQDPERPGAFDWRDRRVLVTGATGIIGSALSRRLLALGAEPVALVRDRDPQSALVRSGDLDRLRVVDGRLEDYADVERAIADHEVDIVVHLAAQTLVGPGLAAPLATFEANVRGTWHVLEACRRLGTQVGRVVVASSDKAYGDSPVLPYTEAMPLAGRHPYDVSKSCADLIAAAYGHTYGLPVAIARCGNVYGPGDLNWSRIVPGTIRATLAGRPVELRSDGTLVRDYVYVEDVVDAYLALAARAADDGVRGEAFNFGPETRVPVRGIVAEVLAVMGRPDLKPVVLGTARAEIREQCLDSAKARRVLGWRARHGLREGLERTVPWYRDLLTGRRAAGAAA